MKWGALLLVAFSCVASAAPRRARPAPVRVAKAPPPPPPAAFELAPDELVRRADAAWRAAEYAVCASLAAEAIRHKGVKLSEEIDAYVLLAKAKAVISDPLDAEAPFRAALRLKPSLEIDPTTPPKIIAAFRKVQTEERVLAERLAREERARLLESLAVSGEPPTHARGGQSLRFSLHLRDPTGAVDELRVAYRREGAGAFSMLALTRGDDGRWSGEVPPEVTANESGGTLEYYVEAANASGPLFTRGDPKLPLAVTLEPGTVPRVRFPRAVATTSLVLTIVAAVAGVVTGGAALASLGGYSGYRGDGSTLQVRSSMAIDEKWNSTWTLGMVSIGALAVTVAAAVFTLIAWHYADPA